MLSIDFQTPLVMNACPVLPGCTCLSIEQVPEVVPYVSIRECLIPEKRGIRDGWSEVLSDYTYSELDKAYAELTIVKARIRDRADRMGVVYMYQLHCLFSKRRKWRNKCLISQYVAISWLPQCRKHFVRGFCYFLSLFITPYPATQHHWWHLKIRSALLGEGYDAPPVLLKSQRSTKLITTTTNAYWALTVLQELCLGPCWHHLTLWDEVFTIWGVYYNYFTILPSTCHSFFPYRNNKYLVIFACKYCCYHIL